MVISVMALITIGIIMVYSSSAVISTGKFGSSFHYLWRHLTAVFIGLVVMILLARTDYHRLRDFVFPLLILSFVLLILVFIPHIGVSAGSNSGVKRWIRLWPLTFQPSELVKIAIVLFMADYMSRNAHRMKELRYGVLIPLAVMAVFQGMIMLQPDFGATVSIGILTITLLFIGGIKFRYIAGIGLLSLPAVVMLIIREPYRLRRITAFLDPWQDPRHSGYQLVQSLLALGRGGVTGVGIGDSKQKNLSYLPEGHTDFIFSLIGEELGLIGVLTVLGLFIYLFIKSFKISMKKEDSYGYYLSLGLTVMTASQALINFAVATGVMPTKGLPLPFISYGGSALLVNMAAIGILINISNSSFERSENRAGSTDGHIRNTRKIPNYADRHNGGFETPGKRTWAFWKRRNK